MSRIAALLTLSVGLAAFFATEHAAPPLKGGAAAAPPSSVVYVAPTDGAHVTGVTGVRVRAPAGTSWIGVYACGGQSVGEDSVIDATSEWSVQWDTRICSNGRQELDTWAFRDDGSTLGNATITAEVGNSLSRPRDPGPRPCQPSAAPKPVAGQRYALRFSDCFDTLSRSVWCSHQWWEASPPVGTQYVEDGVLHLVRRRSDGYPNITVSSEPCGQAKSRSFRRGYFEARMRWTGVPGSGPAFWLFSTAHATNPRWPQPRCPEPTCLSAEIDVFEGYGNHLDVFTGTIHRNSCDCYGEPSRSNSNNWQPQPGMDLSGWHVYAARWTGTAVTWYVDGRRIMSAPVYDSTDQPMHLLFYNWRTPWEDGNETSAATPDELHTEVDWVRVWRRDTSPPRLSLRGRRTQRAGKTITVIVKAASENLWATGSGKLSFRGSRKAYPLRGPRGKFIARGRQATLKLKVPAKAVVAIRRALRRHRTVSVKLTVRARDAAGNTTANRRTLKLTL